MWLNALNTGVFSNMSTHVESCVAASTVKEHRSFRLWTSAPNRILKPYVYMHLRTSIKLKIKGPYRPF
ncbi:hypothetical protein LDENG_00061720 [Lucifuga dentata]|nr:hypothetical protein LDENG_00061720 [Lucifuga dentata]